MVPVVLPQSFLLYFADVKKVIKQYLFIGTSWDLTQVRDISWVLSTGHLSRIVILRLDNTGAWVVEVNPSVQPDE